MSRTGDAPYVELHPSSIVPRRFPWDVAGNTRRPMFTLGKIFVGALEELEVDADAYDADSPTPDPSRILRGKVT